MARFIPEQPWTATPRNWFGLRCALRCCPCSVSWIGRQQWAYCVDCGRPRVKLNSETELVP